MQTAGISKQEATAEAPCRGRKMVSLIFFSGIGIHQSAHRLVGCHCEGVMETHRLLRDP